LIFRQVTSAWRFGGPGFIRPSVLHHFQRRPARGPECRYEYPPARRSRWL